MEGELSFFLEECSSIWKYNFFYLKEMIKREGGFVIALKAEKEKLERARKRILFTKKKKKKVDAVKLFLFFMELFMFQFTVMQ